MRRVAIFESDHGHIKVQPVMAKDTSTKDNPAGDLAYITIHTTTKEISVNANDIEELIELLTEVQQTYIDKTNLL